MSNLRFRLCHQDWTDTMSNSQDRNLLHAMRSHREAKGAPRLLWPAYGIGRWGRLLLILLSLVVLSVQVCHPALHPLEIIVPGGNEHQACPLSHAVAALFTVLSLLICAALLLGHVQEPRPWQIRTCFIHCLAPRPPPM